MCEGCAIKSEQVNRMKRHILKLEAEIKERNIALQEERKNHARLSYHVRKEKRRERHAVRTN